MNTQLTNAVTTGSTSLFQITKKRYRGKNRRRHKRVPVSVGILIHPLDSQAIQIRPEFFAITRDVSFGGLAFLSSQMTDFELALISPESNQERGVVARVCNCCLIHESQLESVYLTSVEFLYERFA